MPAGRAAAGDDGRVSSPTGQVLFDGDIHVHYGFLVLERGDRDDRVLEDLLAARGGQSNGVCGARFPHHLVMKTGLHTGDVPVRVERHDGAPVLDDRWEDVVEVSFDVADDEYALVGFDGGAAVTGLPLGSCRARWSAVGMDAGHRQDTRLDGEPAPDRYLLQVWPAPPAPDDVLRQGSEQAAYWHDVAAETPPPGPPRPRNAEEVRAAEIHAALLAQAAAPVEWQVEAAATVSATTWPAVGQRADQLADADAELARLLAALAPTRQRAVAVRAARLTCELAEVADRGWVEDALARASRREPLPDLWHDVGSVLDRLLDQEPGGHVEIEVELVDPPGRPRSWAPVPPEAAAVDAVREAAGPDDAAAVAGAVDALASAHEDRSAAFAEVRRWLAEPPPAG